MTASTVELTKRERKEIAEVLNRRSNEIAEFHRTYTSDGAHFGSVEIALAREMERLRSLAHRVNPPEPIEEE